MKQLLLIGGMIIAISCGRGDGSQLKPVVSVTILPQQFFVEKVAGSLAEVNVMVPPGASPATYEPTVQQLRKLERSPLYLKVGHVEFERSWMEKIVASNPSMNIVDLSEGIDLVSGEIPDSLTRLTALPETGNRSHPMEENGEHGHSVEEHEEHGHSGTDPHIWMSVRNARIIALNTCEALVTQFPEHAEQFNRNLEKLLVEIDSVYVIISKLLRPYHNGAFMIYHPALTYFAREFQLEQYPLEMDGKTPSPRHMQWMVDMGRDKKISAIFIQKQFDQRNATVLAREIGAQVIRIDPLSADWSSEMIRIAEQLKASLE